MIETDTKSTKFRSIIGIERDASDPEDLFGELIAYIASIQTLGQLLALSASGQWAMEDDDIERTGELIAHQAHTAGDLAFKYALSEPETDEGRAEKPQNGPGVVGKVRPKAGPFPVKGGPPRVAQAAAKR